MLEWFRMPFSGQSFFHAHQEHTTLPDSSVTSQSASTVKPDGLWENMYRRDKYARDRVMKSARLLLPFLSQDDKKPDTILDVGCFTMEAKKYFPRAVKYIGIDQKAYHKETKTMDLNHGFGPISCQHALCLETLEHLLDPEDTLQSIYESLSSDGRLVVSLPNEATLFHRIRCLLGTVDAEAFSGHGKHLHLPSLRQAKIFLQKYFEIEKTIFYISPSAVGSRHAWIGRLLTLIPEKAQQILADHFPSLFARGFIFLLKKSTSEPTGQTAQKQTVS